MIARMRKFGRDQCGVGAVEFALLTPVLLIALMGVFDTAYDIYTSSLLEGAIQDAARNSTLQDASVNLDSIDDRVTTVVQGIAPNATLAFSRSSYHSFSATGKPEDYTDTNKNKKCDKGEPYEDINDNGVWDKDQGDEGSGGARDVVLYKVNVSYPRPFAIASLLGGSATYSMEAKTVLANQPWDNLAKTAKTRNCT